MKSGFKVFMKYEALIYSKTVVYLEKLMPVKSIFFYYFFLEYPVGVRYQDSALIMVCGTEQFLYVLVLYIYVDV